MLYVYVKEIPKECIVDVTSYFNFFKKKEWFDDPFVRKVIKEIDNSEVIKGEYIESPVWGGMSPERLSCGVKALILMRCVPKINVYATKCGDNCSPFILELAESQDVTITLRHYMKFDRDFTAIMMESGRKVCSLAEFIRESLWLQGFIDRRYKDA